LRRVAWRESEREKKRRLEGGTEGRREEKEERTTIFTYKQQHNTFV